LTASGRTADDHNAHLAWATRPLPHVASHIDQVPARGANRETPDRGSSDKSVALGVSSLAIGEFFLAFLATGIDVLVARFVLAPRIRAILVATLGRKVPLIDFWQPLTLRTTIASCLIPRHTIDWMIPAIAAILIAEVVVELMLFVNDAWPISGRRRLRTRMIFCTLGVFVDRDLVGIEAKAFIANVDERHAIRAPQ
jgi:hypothetical protein